MAAKNSMEEEIIVEGNLSDVFKSVSNVLDFDTYKNLNIDNDLCQITANYKDGSIKGEIFLSFISESEKTTKIKIESTASNSISSFMSSSEVIIEMFKERLNVVTNIISSDYEKNPDNINNNYSTSKLTLIIKRDKQWFAVNPPIKIFIDNNREYEIENGKIIKISISPGIHNIKLSCSVRDKIIDINITQNSILNINFNRLTGGIEVSSEQSIFSPVEIHQLPYNTLCVVGITISGISLLLNFFGIVGIVGTALSLAGFLDSQKRNENGKILAIIGIIIGIISILYAFYKLNSLSSYNFY